MEFQRKGNKERVEGRNSCFIIYVFSEPSKRFFSSAHHFTRFMPKV